MQPFRSGVGSSRAERADAEVRAVPDPAQGGRRPLFFSFVMLLGNMVCSFLLLRDAQGASRRPLEAQ